MKIIFLKKTSSTEDYIRNLYKKQAKTRENLAVVSEVQTKGRGTKGRSFSSLKGGAYLSVLTFYDSFSASDAFKINQKISVAVVKTLLAFSVPAKIKWPNDIYVNDKKICGMLINNSFSDGKVDYTITGIGVDVNNDIPEELKDVAVSVKQITGKEIDLKSFIFTLLYNLENEQEVGLYARYSMVLGRKVKIFSRDGAHYTATPVSVTRDGRLLLDDGRLLCAEEVSLRLDDSHDLS